MSPARQQRGSTLLVALIMLMLLTLIAVSAINSTTASIQIVGNAQFREEARSAAQQAIEGTMSGNFTAAPASATLTIGSYTANVILPVCTGSKPLKNADLDKDDPLDAPCFSTSTVSQSGIIYASGVPSATGQSWCLQQQWDVQATVNDSNVTGARVDIHQGVGMRVPAGTECP